MVLLVTTPLAVGTRIDLMAQQSGKDIRYEINKGGWTIPGLSQSKVVGRRTRLQSEKVKSATIYVTTLEPKAEVIAAVSFYSVLDDATLLVTPVRLAVRSILRFDIDNHVFCYGVRGVGAFYDEKSRRGGYGGEYTLLFYDDDGDGRFERLEDAGDPARLLTPKVPDWILQSK
jgi:hypothetical protein